MRPPKHTLIERRCLSPTRPQAPPQPGFPQGFTLEATLPGGLDQKHHAKQMLKTFLNFFLKLVQESRDSKRNSREPTLLSVLFNPHLVERNHGKNIKNQTVTPVQAQP